MSTPVTDRPARTRPPAAAPAAPHFLDAVPWPRWLICAAAVWALASCVTDVPAFTSTWAEEPLWRSGCYMLHMLLATFSLPVAAWRSPWGAAMLVASLPLTLGVPALWALSTLMMYLVLVVVATTATLRFVVAYAAVLAVVVGVLLTMDGAEPVWGWVLYPVLALVTAAGWQTAAARRGRQRALRLAEEERTARGQAVAAERLSIAQDLHDVVAHNMTIATMHAHLARSARSMDEVREFLDVVLDASRESLEDLRVIMDALGAESPAEDPEVHSARTVGEELDRGISALASMGYVVDTSLRGDPDAVDGSLRVGLVPVIREAVTNAVKHGAGRQEGPDGDPQPVCTLDVDAEGGREVRFRLSSPLRDPLDDPLRRDPGTTTPGAAGPALPSSGFGLASAAERVRILGGTFRAGPQGERWVLETVLPRRR
ncbi:sensor histidine kinase [Kocuria dechangensis]|uniref:sensor histidine kinase n=1 Tax=Kocuria dechangensis TaxID=1176249 RepID=UPI0016687213|nr:histidine kinase [Kocuria dechangensis]